MHLPHSDLLSQKKGLFIAMCFSSCSVSVSVALKSRVCLFAGTTVRIVSRSLVKSVQPCSNSRSASSMICQTRPQEMTKTEHFHVQERCFVSLSEKQYVEVLCVVLLTRNWILAILKVLELRMWSAKRPGVATTT